MAGAGHARSRQQSCDGRGGVNCRDGARVERRGRPAEDREGGHKRGRAPAQPAATPRVAERLGDVLAMRPAAIDSRQGDRKLAEAVQLEQRVRVLNDLERDAEEHSPAQDPIGPKMSCAAEAFVKGRRPRAVDREARIPWRHQTCVERRVQADQRRISIEQCAVKALESEHCAQLGNRDRMGHRHAADLPRPCGAQRTAVRAVEY